MRGRIPKLIIELDEPTKANLQALVRSQKTPVGLARRARAILLLAERQPFLHTAPASLLLWLYCYKKFK